MSSQYSQKTTKTISYSSSSGPGGTRVTETTESYGPGGRQADTRTYQTGDAPPQQGMKSMNIGNSRPQYQGYSQPQYHSPAPIQPRRSAQVESRYQKGWGSRSKMGKVEPLSSDGRTYEQIKEQCLREGKLWEDPDFPACDQSIFYSKAPPRPFVWKRPVELMDNPEWFVGGASRFDIQQGELGDCWLLAAVASLCGRDELLYRVVPPDQCFAKSKGYCGIFHFQFWRFGRWVEVIVDDRLPTYYDKLVFMHSAQKNEFWSPLLEKAYAKLVGSYEALKGGATSEAMEDFTGGVTEMYDFRQNAPANLFPIMLKAHERGSLMGCSIEANPNQLEAELANGLIMGHAYSITDVKMVDIQTSRKKGSLPMVRIRNPWGNECEWKGAWSDKSPEWKYISDDERQEIGLTFSDDGEFWMAFNDFKSNFQKLEICNLGPDSENPSSGKRWEASQQEGAWIRRVNAGGCRNYLDSFWTNPQYRIEVTDPDDDDEENMGTLLVGLMQKDRRKKRKEGVDLLTVGYAIYKIKDPSAGPLDMKFFKYNASVAKAPAFINLREVCGRHKLPPGHYAVIPSTFEPNQEGDILLRFFTEKKATSQELDEETGMTEVENPHPLVDNNNYENGTRGFGDYSPNHQYMPHGSGGHAGFPGFNTSWGAKEMEHQIKYASKNRFFNDFPRIHKSKIDWPAIPNFFQNVFQNRLTGERVIVPGAMETKFVIEAPKLPPGPTPEATPEDSKEDDTMRESFRKVAGADMEIDAYELMDILNAAFMKEFKFDGFSSETCRALVAMMDVDRSGKLGFEEFKKLWNDLRLWKTAFKKHDADRSGNFNSYELRQAFHTVGFKVSNSTFNALVMRYAHKDGKIYFDDYIHCVTRLKSMFDIFKDQAEGKSGATFGMDEFIQTTMYS